MLELKHFGLAFGRKIVFDDVTARLASKITGVLGLIGPNGAGKTTLFKAITGQVRFTGEILFEGRPLSNKDVALVPQHPSFWKQVSVRHLIQLHADLSSQTVDPVEIASSVGLSEKIDASFGELSGGQKQRTAIAVAIAQQPKILILDEPMSALDPIGRIEVLDVLTKLRRERLLLISSHILDELETLVDSAVFIACAKIVFPPKSTITARLTFTTSPLRKRAILQALEAFQPSETSSEGKTSTLILACKSAKELNSLETVLPPLLAEHKARLVRFTPEKASLQSTFKQLYQGVQGGLA